MRNSLLSAIVLTLVYSTASMAHASTPMRPEGFIMNAGQWPYHVVAAARSGDVDVFVTRDGMVVDRHSVEVAGQGHVVAAAIEGAATFPRVRFGRTVGVVTFIHGQNRSAWQSVNVVDQVHLEGVRKGVDVVWTIDRGRVRYDFALAAGVDPSTIAMRISGVSQITTNGGELTFEGAGIGMGQLAVIQSGMRVPSSFSTGSTPEGSTIRFDVPKWDEHVPMVIDPIVYGTYLGTGLDSYAGITRLPSGDIAVAGGTTSLEFPEGTGAYKDKAGDGREGFVAILDGQLTRVKAYTFLGGGGDEDIRAITSDAAGDIYVTGTTNSNNFPISQGAARQIYSAMLDAFIVKLADGAKRLAIGTYVGGNADDIPHAIAIDPDLNVYIAGETRSTTGFPTNNGFQRTNGGQLDAFLTKISMSGAQFVYSTFLGRAADDAFLALTVDATGAPYCVGYTRNSNWQTAPTPSGFGQQQRRPYDRTYNGGETDGVVVKFGFDGGTLAYSTYWGGSGNEQCRGVFVDDQGRCHVTMVTSSTNIEDILGFGQQSNGGLEIVQGVFSKDGRDMTSATYFGGAADDEAVSVVADANGNALIGGVTKSMDFPLRGAGSEASRRGPTDGFITALTTGAIRSSNLIVGNEDVSVIGVAGDANGDVYFIASTSSSSHFTHIGAYSANYNGPRTAYIGKLAYGTIALSAPAGGETWCAGTTQTISWGVDEMLTSDRYTVEISDDQGATWRVVGSNIAGANYAWQIKDVESDGYLVQVRSSRGHMVKTPTEVIITTPPTIREQPVPVSDCEGRAATLTVVSDGEGNRYQWRRNGTNIQGATATTYTIAALTTATVGRYDCVVNGRCNPSATSRAVDVAIVNAPVLSKQPASQSVDKGQRLTLAVEALGSGLKYQWLKDGTNISDATATTYEIASVSESDSGSYACRVTSDCGSTLSDVANVIVRDPTSVHDDLLLAGARIIGPNPATHSLAVELPSSYNEAIIDVQTLTGALVSSMPVSGETCSIDVSSLPSGVYLLVVRDGQRSFRSPFVVAR
jgi:ribosomal protein L18